MPITRRARRIGMIAGGTGITPMLQIIRAIFKDPVDKTEVSLIFANKSEDDILLRNELEMLKEQHSDRFHLHFTLDTPPSDWPATYSTGFITAPMVEAHLPSPSLDDHSTQILMCGPPPMLRYACMPALESLGFTEDDWFRF